MKRRTPMRRMSKKREKELAEYARISTQWLKAHPNCEIGEALLLAGYPVACKLLSNHVHHVRGRRGSLLCDTRYFMASCNGECHPRWIHQTHPKQARELGLLA